MDQSEQPRKHYKLRSSLKRQSRNPGGNLDVTDEGQDATLQPPPRRVSFAASRNVKPFLDDPDNNTIWDHTYEEAIISNTDSNNVPSLDSEGNVQETIGEMQKTIFETDMEFTCVNVHNTIGNDGEMQKTIFETDMEFTCVNVQDTIGNGEMQKTFFETDMEFTCMPTNFTQHEEIDMSLTRIEQKENIHSIKLHAKSIKSRKTKPLGINASLMKTTIEGLTLVDPADETICSNKYASPTECQEVDMSLTCKFDKTLIAQNDEHLHKTDNICDSNNKEETNCVSEQKEEINIPIPKPDLENVVNEKFLKPTKFKKPRAKSVKIQETDSIVKNAGCADNTAKPSKTILESNNTVSKLLPESQTIQVAKATPAIFVDSTSDLTLEPEIPAVPNKRPPFGQIYIAADSSVEESKTKVEQPLDKLPSTTESLHEATRSENLTLGETQLLENKTLQKNVIPKATPFKTPAIFVDSANELSLGSKTLAVEKGKDKRIPFGHISIVADSRVDQRQTKVEQQLDKPLDKLTPRSESIHEAVNYKNVKFPNSNIDGDLSIVDLHDKDCTNIFTPPKVIYSEPMPTKPCTSFLDFTSGLSPLSSTGKKQFLNSTLDGTQQLIEATFSKPNRNKSDMDNTNALDSSLPLAEYKPVKFDYNNDLKSIKEGQDLHAKVRLHLEGESRSPKLRKSVLYEKVKRLSICSNYNTPKDQSTEEDDVLLEDFLFDSSLSERSKSLHEKIMDIFQNNVKHVVELHTFEENYYVCSAFANLVWFSVKLHAADGTVEKLIVSSAIEVDYSKSAWPALYDLVASFIINKLQMDNLKSALGTNFDMLSLLDHVIIVTERSLEFFVQFIETRFHVKTLDVSDDGTVSFKILLTDPPTIWTLAFKMASVESIQQDSLVATSRWNTINQEKLKTILRNTEPGIDCIRRFADAVMQYFMQILNVPKDIKII